MPPRTNDFQQFVALLHQQLAPAGAIVTESKMIRHGLTGELREADVTVDYELAGIPIRIYIECRDRGRPADVEWIDQLIGKYAHAGGKVVAVSRSGFTQRAVDQADAAGIETMTIAQASDADWVKWIEGIDRIWVTFRFSSLADVFSVNLVDKTIQPDDYPALRAVDVQFEADDGKPMGTALDIYDELVVQPWFGDAMERSEHVDSASTKFRWRLPAGTVAITPDGRRLAAEGIGFLVKHEEETIAVPLKPGEYAARSIATGGAAGPTWKVKVVYVRQDGQPPRMSIQVSRADGSELPPGLIELFGRDPIAPPPSKS
jgi:hypothetical protein